MRKIYAVLLVLTIVFSALGCKSEGEERLEADPNIPSFVANPPTAEDAIYGVGSAKMTSSSDALRASDARARTDIAAKLKTEVDAMIIDYTRNAGTENNQASLSFYESISQQLTEATLMNVEVVQREQTKDGTYWSLMRMSKSDAAASAAAAIEDVYENEAARYAEFKAMDALKMMQDQLNKE